MNAGVRGLDKKLVPIKALYVRVCRYSGLAGQEQLDGAAGLSSYRAARFAVETNGLPPNRLSQQIPHVDCSPSPREYFLTFANDTQKINVGPEGSCATPTNSVLTAEWTVRWRNCLSPYVTPWGPANTATLLASERVILIDIFPNPEGPVGHFSRSYNSKAFAAAVRAFPSELPPSSGHQSCQLGATVVLTLADGTRRYYGPCSKPEAIVVAMKALYATFR
jgi:hypothetical protein